MSALNIDYKNPRDLVPYVNNARTHGVRQIREIARSIEKFGFNNPILIDRQNGIVAGHGRVLAAIELGRDYVPTILLEHLTPAQKRAYVIADNKLAEKSGWDKTILAMELQELISIDSDFEITDTGFEMAEIDQLLGEDAGANDEDIAPEPSDIDGPAMARPGDLWALGDHLLFCGDALDGDSYRALMGQELAQAVFTDPPYNVRIEGNVSGLGKVKHGEFAMASGEMTQAQFVGFLKSAFGKMARWSVAGSIHYICMDWRHLAELMIAGEDMTSSRICAYG